MMNWYGGTNPFVVLIKQLTWVAQIKELVLINIHGMGLKFIILIIYGLNSLYSKCLGPEVFQISAFFTLEIRDLGVKIEV